MPNSMTAFAQGQIQLDNGTLCFECRTLNHRFLEIIIRLPEGLHSLEPQVRQQISRCLNRGKVDAFFVFKPHADQKPFTVNDALAKQVVETHQQLQQQFPDLVPATTTDILNTEGVLQTPSLTIEELGDPLSTLVQEVLQQVCLCRNKEGETISGCIQQYAHDSQNTLNQLSGMQETLIHEQRQRIQSKFDEAQLELDPARFAQEMVIFAQKTEVTEELDRANSHIKEILNLLAKDEPVGKQIDFYIQELHREANTLGAKIQNNAAKKLIIDLKVSIEKMREQSQNVE